MQGHDAMSLAAGQRLDNKYLLLRTLGRGGFGQVWLAQDTVLGDHHVAIKFLTSSSPAGNDAFLTEMRTLAALNLPGIVTFHHHFMHGGQLALVMEHCTGGSLAQKLGNDQSKDAVAWTHQVVQWLLQLCDTLTAVHSRGLVHHDIKPPNILLRNGSAVLADFGIVNTGGGTVIYSSPNKGLGLVEPDDGREDIYALGVTLLELLIRSHPWRGLKGNDLVAAKRQRILPDDLDAPSWLLEIALKAIHPDEVLRFQTAADMAGALRARNVPVYVDRNALKAHRAVLAGELALKRGHWSKAEKAAVAARHLSPNLPSAVLLAGRIKLLQHQPDAAYDILKDAAQGPSSHLMGLELGWLHLQRGDLPRALSTLSDEVTRNPLNIEALCLLLECYWKVRRFDEMKRLAEVLRIEKCDNKAIENASLMARLALSELDVAWLKNAITDGLSGPFSVYNMKVALTDPLSLGERDRLLEKLIFQDYRFGLPSAIKATNTVVVEFQGKRQSFTQNLISIGQLNANDLTINSRTVSRRHAVIVNMGHEVWLHDLHSTQGTWVQGVEINKKQTLLGVHDVRIGSAELRVWSRHDLIA
jgi:serine/threonine protein kinase